MKILFISNGSLTHPILHSQGLPQLLKIVEAGNEVSLMTFEKQDSLADTFYSFAKTNILKNKITHIPVRLIERRLPLAQAWVWLLGIMKAVHIYLKYKPEIIHCRSYHTVFIALAIKMLFPVKVVFDTRGIYVDEMVENKSFSEGTNRYRIERFLEKIYLKYSNSVICISSAQKQYYSNLNNSSQNLNLVVIPNCADLNKFSCANKRISDFENITLLYSGHFTTKYDVPSIFEFFKKLSEHSVNCKLKILTYMYIEPFEKLIATLPSELQHRVIIKKSVPTDVPENMADTDVGIVLLNPLLSNKVSSPIKLVEYLAAGKPVIVSENVGDSALLLKKHNTGIIFKQNDLDETVIDLRDLLRDENINEKCIQTVNEELSIDISVKKYLSVYEELLDEK